MKKVKDKLQELGAEKKFEGEVKSIYYILDDKRLLRLRKKNKDNVITFKKLVDSEKTKSAEEYETRVEDFETCRKIFSELGYSEKVDEKHRISYSLDNVSIEIDSLPGIPPFLEIEAETYKELEKIVEQLEFKMEETKPWSGKDVSEYYNH